MQTRPASPATSPTRRRPRAGVAAALAVAVLAVGGPVPAQAATASDAAAAGTGAAAAEAPASEIGAVAGPAAGVDTPELRELRERASQAQRDLVAATAAYAESERKLAEAQERAETARVAADAARAEVVRLRQIVQDYAAAAYKGQVGNDFVVVLDVVSSGNARKLDGAGYVDRVRKGQNEELDDLAAAEAEAEEQSRAAEQWLATATAEEAELARRAAEVQELARVASSDLQAHVESVEAALAAATAEQAARGAGATARWQAYLDRLAAARVVPPPAAALADPAALPEGMRPVPGAGGAPTPGVAEVTDVAGLPLRVLPAETVEAVTAALGAIGTPYRSGATGPAALDCGGLVASVFPGLGRAPADQFAVVQPVDRADAEVGDLVFLGSDAMGLTHVGVHLGAGEMVSASRAVGSVQVASVPPAVLGFGRATLAPRAPVAPPASRYGTRVECGGHDQPAARGASGSWGGYPNGLIPTSALCPVAAAPGHRLRCDAAVSFDAMAAQYAADLRRPLCVTDSYRTYGGQVDVYARKPHLAAVPGTSNHGWALALDLCGGVERFGTREHGWMVANAPAYGWVHPRWAQAGGSRPEAWHWEFGAR